MKKRIIGLVLALVVAFSAMPLAASACIMPCTVTPAVGVTMDFHGYTYYDFMAEKNVKVPLYVVTVPKNTKYVTLRFAKGQIAYNYDDQGNYLAGNFEYDGKGVKRLRVAVDAVFEDHYSQPGKVIYGKNDGKPDIIQVQNPYNSDYSGGELRYAIKFKYSDKTLGEYLGSAFDLVRKLVGANK
ncbi:MAG: hypothetical protein MJ146_00730 [Clostridia bacterium]|nr:hypothetical protein [Clostridia bacterium]